MKLRFLSGGTFVPPFAVYQPYILPSSLLGLENPKKQSKSKSESSDIGIKDVLTLVSKLEGLPGDTRAVLDRVELLIDKVYKKLSTPEGFYGGTNSIAAEYAELLTLVSTVQLHLDRYKKAEDNAIEKGTINEVVIDSMGRLKVLSLDTQQYEWISLEEYDKNPDLYQPITNGLLLNSRFNGEGGLAFDTESIAVIEDGVSMKSISDKILGDLEKLGEQSMSITGYVSKEQREALKGIQTFKEAAKTSSKTPSIENLLFKEKIISKSLADQIISAFNYIYNNLNTKEKALLRFNSRNVEGGLTGLLSQLIASRQGITYEYEAVDDVVKNGSGSKERPENIIQEFNMNPAELLEAGYGNKQRLIIQTPLGKDAGIDVVSVSLPLMNSNKNPLGTITTLDEVSRSVYSGALDMSNISMGGGIIDPLAATDVTVSGGIIHLAYLPVSASSGYVKPDIDMLRRFKEALTKIVEDGVENDPVKVNEYYTKYELPIMYDDNGNVIPTNYRKFAMMNGTAIDTAFRNDVSLEKWLTEVNDENLLDSSLRVIAKARGVEVDFDKKSWWDANMGFWNSHNSLYKGVIFIPYNDDIIARSVGAGNYPNAQEAAVLEAQNQTEQKAQRAVFAGML